MSPEVSVLMSVYNGERFVCQAVESILGQTFSDFEFIIIDDGSNDKSREIISGYHDSRIRFFENKENIGLTRSLNLGLEIACGDFIARMDSDDISLPDRIQMQFDFFEDHPEVGVLGTGFQLIDDEGCTVSSPIIFPTTSDFIKWSLWFYNPIVHSSVMMRRDVVQNVGGYNPTITRSQDRDLWCRLSKTIDFANLGNQLLLLRKHDKNVSVLQYDTALMSNINGLINRFNAELNLDVSDEIVRCLYTGDYPSPRYGYEVARLVYLLSRTYSGDVSISPVDKEDIRKDSLDRLSKLFKMIPWRFHWLRKKWQILRWISKVAHLREGFGLINLIK